MGRYTIPAEKEKHGFKRMEISEYQDSYKYDPTLPQMTTSLNKAEKSLEKEKQYKSKEMIKIQTGKK